MIDPMITVDSGKEPKTEPMTTAAIFISNLVVPGLGLCLRKQVVRGLVIEFIWMLSLGVLVWAMAFHGLHPVKTVIIVATIYSILQADMLLQPTKKNASNTLSLLSYLTGLLFFIIILDSMLAFGFRPYLGLAVVSDMGEFPILLPGDIVLYKHTTITKADVGSLMVVKPLKMPKIQRMVGISGDIIDLEGPHLTINGQKWPQNKIGTAITLMSNQPAGIHAYQETVPGTKKHHLVFFSSQVEQAKFRKKVNKYMFFLADNRSTDNTMDSRIIGPISPKDVLGKPLIVLMSIAPKGGIHFRRSGIRLDKY